MVITDIQFNRYHRYVAVEGRSSSSNILSGGSGCGCVGGGRGGGGGGCGGVGDVVVVVDVVVVGELLVVVVASFGYLLVCGSGGYMYGCEHAICGTPRTYVIIESH